MNSQLTRPFQSSVITDDAPSPFQRRDPAYVIALELFDQAKSMEKGARNLCVWASLQHLRMEPVIARVWHPLRGFTSDAGWLDRLACWLLGARQQTIRAQAIADMEAALRKHLKACEQWLEYREDVLMLMEADQRRLEVSAPDHEVRTTSSTQVTRTE